MKNLLVYLKKYKLQTILGPLFKLFEATLELLIPLIVALIIDEGIHNNDTNQIIKYSLLICLLGMIGFIFSVIAQYFSAKAAVGLSTVLRSKVFEKIQNLSFNEYDKLGTSTMITRITNDINQIQNGVNLTLRIFLRSPFIVFGSMIMAFTIDTKAALVFVVTIPILAFIVFLILLYTMPLYKKVQQNVDEVVCNTRENLTGVRVLRAFSKEEDEISEYIELNKVLQHNQNFVAKISNFMNPITYTIVNLAIIVLLWITSIEVNIGILTQGEVIAIYNYMSQILVELIKLANLIISISKALASANRVNDILQMQSSLSSDDVENISSDSYIEFKNVYFKYGKAKGYSLTDISFKVNRGEIIGIIGATGSGKSTLVNLIPHFYDVSSGFITIDGKSISSFDIKDLRSKIGFAPQKAVLFEGTIKSNLMMGNELATNEDMLNALNVSQSLEFVKMKENGLESIVEQNGRNFSGGQKQRLTIARALIRKFEIIIFDDSQSALDYATDSKIRENLKNLDYKPTIFIVSQRTSSIKHADKIIVLDDGKMIGYGNHEKLLKECDVYAQIHYSQYKKESV